MSRQKNVGIGSGGSVRGDEKPTAKEPDVSAVLALARETGSIAEACRRLGVERTSFYRARRRMERMGAGTRSRSPLSKPPEVETGVVALSLEYPEWGCDRIAWYFSLKGTPISSPTVQKILIRHGLGRMAQRYDAAARMEDEGVRGGFALP